MAFKLFSHHRTFRWMRQLHLWIGAWGAIAALLFGTTGLVLNHRIGDNAWAQGRTEPVRKEQVAVPAEARTSPEVMSQWLRKVRGLDADMIRKPRPGGEGARPDGPGKWIFSGGSASNSWSAEYVMGGENVDVKWTHSTALAVFNKLHKNVGGGKLWRVLADTYAIAMILLALTGLWMWARGRSAKDMLLSVFALAVLASGSAIALAFL